MMKTDPPLDQPTRQPESGSAPTLEESLHRVLLADDDNEHRVRPTVNTDASSLPEEFRPSKRALLDALVRAKQAQTRAEIDQAALICGLCDAYEALNPRADDDADRSARVLFGEKQLVPPEGTSRVGEFVTLELGPALGISPTAAWSLVWEVLALRARHPITWNQVLSGRVPVWLGRKIAQRCAELGAQACGELDARIGPELPGWGPKKTMREVDRWRALLDPQAEAKRQQAKAAGFVRIEPDASIPGRAWLTADLCGTDARHLDETLTKIAKVLKRGGHDGSRDALRALALGHLAHPDRAARLLQQDLFEAGAEVTDDGHIINTTTGEVVTEHDSKARCEHGAMIVVHVKASDLSRGGGGEVDGLGPITQEHLAELLRQCAGRVTVRPVADLAAPLSTDAHAPTAEIIWRVKNRDDTEMFPYSERSAFSSRVDLDHTIAHGDTGPTCTTNLGPLSRRVHRAKTFGGFLVTQESPGVYHWVTPLGREYWTNRHGTWTHRPPEWVTNQPDQTTTAVLARILQAAAEEAATACKQGIPRRDPDTGEITLAVDAPPPF